MADLSLPLHHNPPAIRGAGLAPKLNWLRGSGGVIRGPQVREKNREGARERGGGEGTEERGGWEGRGEGTDEREGGGQGRQGLGNCDLSGHPQRPLLLFQVYSKSIFEDPDGGLMGDLSLPSHHNPPAIRGPV